MRAVRKKARQQAYCRDRPHPSPFPEGEGTKLAVGGRAERLTIRLRLE